MAITDGLLAVYSMDETAAGQAPGGKDVEDSVGSAHGTATGVVYNNTGKLGKALDFDASDDVVDVTGTWGLVTNDPWSIMAWVFWDSDHSVNGGWKSDSGDNYQGIVHMGEPGGTGLHGGFNTSFIEPDNNVFVIHDPGVALVATQRQDLVDDTWIMVVATYDGSGGFGAANMKIWVGQVGTDAVPLSDTLAGPGAGSPVTIGTNATIGRNIGNLRTWGGLIDEVGIWDRVLTEEEIITLYNGGAGVRILDADSGGLPRRGPGRGVLDGVGRGL